MEQTELNKLKEVIAQNQSFVLTCHVNPDGDALGSTLGLQRVLINLGKKATVITPDLAPSYFAWMPGYKTLKTYERETDICNEIIDEADVIFILDYNDLKRTKTLGEKISATNGKTTVMIDHHLDPIYKADITFSNPQSPATCELVFRILRECGYDASIDIESASNLYTGIITDTGALNYNSSDPELYILVAELLKKGIDKSNIHDKIFNNKTVRRLKLLGFTLGKKLHRIEKSPFSIMTLNAQELDQYNYNTGDTEGFVNYPLQVKDIIANAFIMERPDGIKISLRSKGDFPVNEFASQFFNGGGHTNAAGGNYIGKLDDAVNIYTNNIVKFYNQWLKRDK